MTAQNTEHANQPPEYHTDLPVGEILRRTRVHYNQSIQDVAGFMRIRVSQLDAIEKGEVEKLPGRVYAIGYVRTYSEYLGLDGEKMVQLFKQQSLNRTVRPELHFPVAASESKAPNFFLIFASLGVLVVVLGGWMVMSNKGGKAETQLAEIPNVPSNMRVADVMGAATPADTLAASGTLATPDATQAAAATVVPGTDGAQPPAPTPVATDGAATVPVTDAAATTAQTADAVATANATAAAAAAAAIAEPAAAPVPPPRQITITVRERSWVEVRDVQNKAILSRILKPGEVFIVPEENYGLRLDTGNAGGLELMVNGQPIPPLGRSGDILRGMVLDGNQLLQKAGTAAKADPVVAPVPATATAPAATAETPDETENPD